MPVNYPLRGIIPPLITPFHEDFSLDEKSLRTMINHVIEGGVHGIFILGTTGEFSGITFVEKLKLIKETCKVVDERVPILVGISSCSLRESLQLAAAAADYGAELLVATTPYYMNIGQQELITYFETLASGVSLPLFLYNMPSHTGIKVEIETVVALSKHPNIIGIKDSSGDLDYFKQLSDAFKTSPEFAILVGPEEILVETMAMGGHGGVAGGANLFPKLYVEYYEAINDQNHPRVQELQNAVNIFGKNIYSYGTYKSGYLKGLKACLAFAGLCNGVLASPLTAYSDKELVDLRGRYELVLNHLNTIL
jgi:4-hydroxy-tetrahydrodipicolinate synthase